MGRRRNESSPVNAESNPCPASTPVSRRIAVPEFPMSRIFPGALSPESPVPRTRVVLPQFLISAPNCRQALAVAFTSSASSNPSIADSPRARLARIKARWEMDLSPGGTSSPRNGAVTGAVSSITRPPLSARPPDACPVHVVLKRFRAVFFQFSLLPAIRPVDRTQERETAWRRV